MEGDSKMTTEPLLHGKPERGPLKAYGQSLLARFRTRMQPVCPSNTLILAVIFGVQCGIIAVAYNTFFLKVIWFAWEWVPNHLFYPMLTQLSDRIGWFPNPQDIVWTYTVVAATLFGTAAGVTQHILGSPGDLPDTVRSIHEEGYLSVSKAPSMFLCSALCIAAGGSLGPEAPLLALCGSSCSWVGRNVLQYKGQRLRNCALLGMTAGLAAFFGVALGGSLFALEVLHRTGMQFYEIATYAVATGTICLAVFRGLSGMPFGAIWTFTESVPELDYRHVLLGLGMGVVAAGLGLIFMRIHKIIHKLTRAVGLHEHNTPIMSGMTGGLMIGIIGMLLPPVMFWGEFEIDSLINKGQLLPHIWPKGGLWGGTHPFLENHYTPHMLCLIAVVKLICISITVVSGFRGGFIFPLFFSGTALGLAISTVPSIPFISDLPPVMLAMTMAAGLNTVITRTPFATSLILTTLSGHPEVAVPCLASSLIALFLTLPFPFIMAQRDRQDIMIRELELTPEERAQSVEIEHGHISGTVQAQLNGNPIEGHLSGMLTNGQISGAAGHVEGHDEVINVGGV